MSDRAVQSVFISGGTSGINLGIAAAFAKAGASVVVSGRNEEKAKAAVTALSAVASAEIGYVIADVRDYEAVFSTMQESSKRIGAFDVVIAGAAGNFFAPATGISPNGFKSVVDIDLLGTFHVFKAGFELCSKEGASFIAITAPQADNATPLQAHVCAAKAGVNALLKTLAMEWGPRSIRVNGISPGLTEGTEGLDRLIKSDPERAKTMVDSVALRAFGSVAQIGDAALFLSSPSAEYVTGTILKVDGGYQLGDASADFLGSSAK